MQEYIQTAVYRGLSDSIEVACDTGNHDELLQLTFSIQNALSDGQLTTGQAGDLLSDINLYLDKL